MSVETLYDLVHQVIAAGRSPAEFWLGTRKTMPEVVEGLAQAGIIVDGNYEPLNIVGMRFSDRKDS